MKSVVKRALVAPLITAAATLPAVTAHSGVASAAPVSPAVSASPAVAARFAAANHQLAGNEPGSAAKPGRPHHHPRHGRRYWAFVWARDQHGKPYCWGGTGGCFDCSGLVMAAYRHQGLYFGRDTIDMLSSGRLIRVGRRHAKKGDLAFYGTGHVELVGGHRYTLGALHFGTVVGWHRLTVWWHPTMYFRVRGAGRRG